MNKILCTAGSLAVAALLASCSSAPDKNVFIGNDKPMTHDDRIPVQKVWKDPSAVMANYDKIIIKDVRTDRQLPQSWLERHNARAILGHEDGDLKELAVYLKKSFSEALTKQPGRLKLVEKPGPRTIVLEMAIVKVIANKPVIEVGTTLAAGIVRPISLCLIPVKSVASRETQSPLCAYLAIEGKILDSQTGKELVLFATGAREEGALLDINKLTSPYANVRDIIDRWSRQFVEIANKRPLETNNKVVEEEHGVAGYSLLKF